MKQIGVNQTQEGSVWNRKQQQSEQSGRKYAGSSPSGLKLVTRIELVREMHNDSR